MNKLSKSNKKAFKARADEFLNAMREKVSIYLLLEDVDALGRLVAQMAILGDYEVMQTLRNKGMEKEIMELCDKAGLKK